MSHTFDEETNPAPQSVRDLELLAGGPLMNVVGALALVIGAGFFLKYAIDRDWIDVAVRVLGGAVLGAGMLGAGEVLRRRGVSRWYSNGIAGAGLGMLYLSGYAAFETYHLVSQAFAYAFMLLVSGTAFALALRYRSVAFAVIGWAGGFATPFVMDDVGTNAVAMTSYLALLDLSLLALAWRRPSWVGLQPLAAVASYLAMAAWYAQNGTSTAWQTEAVALLAIWAVFFAASLARALRTLPASFDAGLLVEVFNGLAAWAGLFYVVRVPVQALIASQPVLDVLTFAGAIVYAAAYFAVQWRSAEPLRARFVHLATSASLIGLWSLTRDGNTLKGATMLAVLAMAFALIAPLLRRLGFPVPANDASLGVPAPLLIASAALSALTALVSPRHLGLSFDFGFGNTDLALTMLMAAAIVVERLAARADAARPQFGIVRTLAVLSLVGLCAIHLDGYAYAGTIAALGLLAALIGTRGQLRDLEIASLGLFGLSACAMALAPNAWEYGRIFDFHPLVGGRLWAMGALGVAALIAGEAFRRRSIVPHVDRLLRAAGVAIVVTAASLELRDTFHLAAAYAQNRVDVEEALTRLQDTFAVALATLWVTASAILLAVGMRTRTFDLRAMALGLFDVTVLKVFFVDLVALETPYRIVAFMGLGLVLLLVSYAYHRLEKAGSLGGKPRLLPEPLDSGATA